MAAQKVPLSLQAWHRIEGPRFCPAQKFALPKWPELSGDPSHGLPSPGKSEEDPCCTQTPAQRAAALSGAPGQWAQKVRDKPSDASAVTWKRASNQRKHAWNSEGPRGPYPGELATD